MNLKPIRLISSLCMLAMLVISTANLSAAEPREKSFKLWPILQYDQNEQGEKVLEILWPLIDYRTTDKDDPYKLLHLLSIKSDKNYWRAALLFNLVGGQANTNYGAWSYWLFPALWFGKDNTRSHQVIFPLWYNTKSGNENSSYQKNKRGILFLIWQGQTINRNKQKKVTSENHYFHLFPFLWSSVKASKTGSQSEMRSVFPIYYHKTSERNNKDSLSNSKTKSALFLYWHTNSARENFKNQTKWTNKNRILFPFYWANDSKKDNNKYNEFRTISNRTLFPIQTSHNSQTTNKNGDLLKLKSNGHVIPLLYWDKKIKDGKLRRNNLVVFPFYWDFMKLENKKKENPHRSRTPRRTHRQRR